MSFTSLSFLLLVAGAVLVYYLLPQHAQWCVLLAASLVFYCVGGGKTVLYVFYTAAIVYVCGLLLGHYNDLRRAAPKEERKAVTARYKPRRRAVVLVACLLNFGLLYVLKYWNFTADLFLPLADRAGVQLPLSELVLPLGVSFFMFQSVGYVIDVYRDKYAPEHHFGKLLLFVSFFPQMVQGPISRFGDLGPQLLAGRSLDFGNLKYGIQLMLWGYFKKLVIADRAAVLVSSVLDTPGTTAAAFSPSAAGTKNGTFPRRMGRGVSCRERRRGSRLLWKPIARRWRGSTPRASANARSTNPPWRISRFRISSA